MTHCATEPLSSLPVGAGLLEVCPGYAIRFGVTQLLTLVVPFDGTPWEPWTDRATCGRPCILAYKHETHHGKRWEEREGFELEFTIPKAEVSVVVGTWYSYPRVIVGGVEMTLNVGGSTMGDGWTDNISLDRASTMVNLPPHALKAISSVALSRRFELQKSRQVLEQEWQAEHAGDLQVLAAWGSWAPWVPAGMVGVCACVGGHAARRGAEEVWALVPAQEYAERGSIGSFIVDPERHHLFEGCPHREDDGS